VDAAADFMKQYESVFADEFRGDPALGPAPRPEGGR
jgi:hypothetical protein